MIKLLLSLLALALGTQAVQAAQAEPIPVTASFSIIADMVRRVGGDLVTVSTIVSPDSDAHSFEPTPKHIKRLSGSKILFINGLGFEGWMDRLQRSADFKGKVVVVSTGIKPLQFQEDPDHGLITDPHAWQDLSNGIIYVHNIAAALQEALPNHAQEIKTRAEAYISLLQLKHNSLQAAIAKIPPQHRKIITSHDAFGYFGRAYGIVFMAPIGISTEEEASAQTMAKLVKQIKLNGIRTIFVENAANSRLAQQLAHEAQVKIGGTLYADALSNNKAEAASYLAMFDHNIAQLLPAMQEITTP